MFDAKSLLEEARREPVVERGPLKPKWGSLVPVVDELRDRGLTWHQVAEWLMSRGAVNLTGKTPALSVRNMYSAAKRKSGS